jgi:hypothetical protein
MATPLPLDAERARLRASGFSDDEISKILIEREIRSQQQAGAPASTTPPAIAVQPQQPQGAAGVAGQGGGVFSTVLGSLLAVVTYVKDSLAAIPDHARTVRDGNATPAARAEAGRSLILTLAIVGVLGFAAWQEWQQHIIYATETAKNQMTITAAQKIGADFLIREETARRCDAKASAVAQMTPSEFQSMTAQQKTAIDAFCDTNPTQQQILVWLDKNFPDHRSLCGAGEVYSRGACGPLAP